MPSVGERAREELQRLRSVAGAKRVELSLLVDDRRFGALASYCLSPFLPWRPYDSYVRLRQRLGRDERTRTVGGHEFVLDPADEGICRDLSLYGTREPTSIRVYRDELRRLRDADDRGPTALDVGSNIGYFALTAADALGSDGTVYAFEPTPRTRDYLRRNVERNGYADRIDVVSAAVGEERGTATLQHSTHANLNRIRDESTRAYPSDTDRTTRVELRSIDEFLADRDVDPDAVRAVRMDVEGYEYRVLGGAEDLLAADGPLVLFFEIHPAVLDGEELGWIADTLDSNGFQVVHAVNERIGVYSDPDVTDVSELASVDQALNVIVRR